MGVQINVNYYFRIPRYSGDKIFPEPSPWAAGPSNQSGVKPSGKWCCCHGAPWLTGCPPVAQIPLDLASQEQQIRCCSSYLWRPRHLLLPVPRFQAKKAPPSSQSKGIRCQNCVHLGWREKPFPNQPSPGSAANETTPCRVQPSPHQRRLETKGALVLPAVIKIFHFLSVYP